VCPRRRTDRGDAEWAFDHALAVPLGARPQVDKQLPISYRVSEAEPQGFDW
jgi:hypothetical protein